MGLIRQLNQKVWPKCIFGFGLLYGLLFGLVVFISHNTLLDRVLWVVTLPFSISADLVYPGFANVSPESVILPEGYFGIMYLSGILNPTAIFLLYGFSLRTTAAS